MCESLVVKDVGHGTAASRFGTCGPDDDLGDAGLDTCSRTHLAGLKCHIHRAVLESPVVKLRTGLFDGDHLGVRKRGMIGISPVVTASYDLSLMNDDAAYGHFAGIEGFFGQLQRFFHVFFVFRKHTYTVFAGGVFVK